MTRLVPSGCPGPKERRTPARRWSGRYGRLAPALLCACGSMPPSGPPAAPSDGPPAATPADPPTPAIPARPAPSTSSSGLHRVELALDRGHFEADDWVSEPTSDVILYPEVHQVGDRALADLADGERHAVIRRACGSVSVPFAVTAATTVVSLPYPACGAEAPAGPWTGDDVDQLHRLGLLASWPAEPGPGPAVWVSFDDAFAACRWYGLALPDAPVAVDPAVGTWLRDGRAVGGPWPTPAAVPAAARDHALGVACGGRWASGSATGPEPADEPQNPG